MEWAWYECLICGKIQWAHDGDGVPKCSSCNDIVFLDKYDGEVPT
jgi:hypothetical protein